MIYAVRGCPYSSFILYLFIQNRPMISVQAQRPYKTPLPYILNILQVLLLMKICAYSMRMLNTQSPLPQRENLSEPMFFIMVIPLTILRSLGYRTACPIYPRHPHLTHFIFHRFFQSSLFPMWYFFQIPTSHSTSSNHGTEIWWPMRAGKDCVSGWSYSRTGGKTITMKTLRFIR